MASATWRAELELRPITGEDLVAWARLYDEVAPADGLAGSYGMEDLARWLDHPQVDPVHDSLGAFTPAGEMAGFGLVVALPTAGEAHIVSLPGAVRPAYRGQGIGRYILGWQEKRGHEAHCEMFPDVGGLLLAGCPEGATDYRRLYERAGLSLIRWVYRMERDLRDGPPIGERPALGGLELVGVDRDRDMERVRRAHNDAFSGQWGSTELTPAFWRTQRMGSPAFRPDLSFVAVDPDDEVAGYVLSYVHDDSSNGHEASVVDLGQIGTRSRFRGQGVGSALVVEALRAYQAAGYERAELHVDAANPTGAVSFYIRHGFVTLERQARHARAIPPLTPEDER